MSLPEDLNIREHRKFREDRQGNTIVATTDEGTVLAKYQLNNIEEGETITYLGSETKDGDWFVKKIDSSSGYEFGYATETNNSETTDYSTAWTNRATLTYGTFSQAF